MYTFPMYHTQKCSNGITSIGGSSLVPGFANRLPDRYKFAVSDYVGDYFTLYRIKIQLHSINFTGLQEYPRYSPA